ncbi:MAG: hypothetical protein Q9207_001504 [Kuettlingeria erythrocarpa]
MSPQPDAIQIVNGLHRETAYTYYPILIVGAGESGIALGARLTAEGFDQFRIFERQAGLGGTWWSNRYPGVACDVPAAFYSFSFSPNYRWTSLHPEGAEIYEYLSAICEKYHFVDKIQFDTDVSELRWLDKEQIWEATLTYMVSGTGDLSRKEKERRIAENGKGSVYLKQEIVRARIVCSCAGGLVEPNAWPSSIPGRDTFEGPVFHSARWDHSVPLKDKNVVVIGTGCSAAQFVPLLTKEPYNAKSITQIMRSPPWVVPKPKEPFGRANYKKYSPALFSTVPGLAFLFRLLCFANAEKDWYTIFDDNSWNHKSRKNLEAQMVARMKAMVPEKYHEILTPNYSIGCKRRIFDAAWYECLNDPKIELTTKPITKLSPHSVTIGPGRQYPDPTDKESRVPTDEETIPADVIILGNGFEVTTWLHPLKIRGKNGDYMQDVWDARGGPQAYLGLAMDGFPNLFIIFGPNTATGHSSVILASENMIEYTIKVIKKILHGEVATAEVKKESEIAWTKTVQDRLKRTVFNGGCTLKSISHFGFTSQFQYAGRERDDESTSTSDAWDLSVYSGLEVDVGVGDGKVYTLIVKDEQAQDKRDDGREQAGINWEAQFRVGSQHGMGEETEGKKLWIPWSALKPTYRGKEKENAEKLRTSDIRRLGFMMRRSAYTYNRTPILSDSNGYVHSYFGSQQGHFRLVLRSVSARQEPSRSAETLQV